MASSSDPICSLWMLSFLVFNFFFKSSPTHTRKHIATMRQFAKYLFLGYDFLGNYTIICVLTKFWETSPGKFDLFLWYFFLLETVMCSNEILDKIPWKIWSVFMIFFSPGKSYVFFWKFWCVLVRFASPGKFTCVLVPFLVLLENLMCSIKGIMSSPGNSFVFLLNPSLLENLMCSRNLFKKVTPGQKEQIF